MFFGGHSIKDTAVNKTKEISVLGSDVLVRVARQFNDEK